jgi:hypothetical protein
MRLIWHPVCYTFLLLLVIVHKSGQVSFEEDVRLTYQQKLILDQVSRAHFYILKS